VEAARGRNSAFGSELQQQPSAAGVTREAWIEHCDIPYASASGIRNQTAGFGIDVARRGDLRSWPLDLRSCRREEP
jgi:hypothetical protein